MDLWCSLAQAPSRDTSLYVYFYQALRACRQKTLGLVANIQPEVLKCQAHPDFSPIGWHLGHIAYTESVWIGEYLAGRPGQFSQYLRLFAADGLPKAAREKLPDLAEILVYMEEVRSQTLHDLATANLSTQSPFWHWLLQHESQHIETMTMVLALHELQGAANQPKVSLNDAGYAPPLSLTDDDMVYIRAGDFRQGSDAPAAIDNETPAHSVWLDDYWIDRRPVTYRQYRQFIEAGGYRQAKWWTTAGWQWQQSAGVEAPLYQPKHSQPKHSQPKHRCEGDDRPVCGVSWYEADAYARFAGKRLPSEAEWAKAAGQSAVKDTLGGVWEWTDTWFDAYPGFRPFPYAGYSQIYFDRAHRVLRGGSWATPQWVLRHSFRNWYHPDRRELFAGFRCAA